MARALSRAGSVRSAAGSSVVPAAAATTPTSTSQSSSSSSSSSDTLVITTPDDWHLHLRDGSAMRSVVGHSAVHYGRAIVMPNLVPPVTTTELVWWWWGALKPVHMQMELIVQCAVSTAALCSGSSLVVVGAFVRLLWCCCCLSAPHTRHIRHCRGVITPPAC